MPKQTPQLRAPKRREAAEAPTSIIWLNGKWTSQLLTGTQRFSSEVFQRLDSSIVPRCIVALPADGMPPDWLLERFNCVRSQFSGQLFEQVWLPLKSLGNPLVSLAGPAPITKRRQLVVMHDAGVFRVPFSYSPQFRAWYRMLYRVLSRGPASLCTVSNFSRQELASLLRTSAESFSVVPCGSDHVDHIEETQVSVPVPVGQYALMVGSLAPHKRTSAIIEEFARSDSRLVVVGMRPSGKVLKDAGLEVGSETPNISYVGRITDGELKYLYRRAGALLVPSEYEGFGIPLIEAQRLGCPVICSSIDSFHEVAGKAATFVSRESANDFLDAFESLIADGDERSRMIDLGTENAARYVWQHAADRISQLIQRL